MERGTVLVVDDEQAVLGSLKGFFSREYEILTASSAEEAMQLLRQKRIHVVISDFKMPGQDGLSFLIEAKRLFPGTIRVLMTAYADMNLVVRALNEGEIHRFISKPYRFFEFRKILEDCLKLSGLIEKKDSPPTRERLVLIAHDSQITLSTLRITLGSSYRLLSTSNGLDVLSLVSANPVDALVVGVGLEMMDGCTIISYLKKEKKESFPFIVWSRDITGPFEEHLRDCGADLWIDEANPSAPKILREFLRERLA